MRSRSQRDVLLQKRAILNTEWRFASNAGEPMIRMITVTVKKQTLKIAERIQIKPTSHPTLRS
jgi:hypothetical protein